MQDRPSRTDRRTDRRLVVLLALAALAVLVVRSPMGVLTMLAPSAPPAVIAGTSPTRGSSDDARLASVRERDAGGVAAPEEADAIVRAPDDAADGRFGAPALRPTTTLLLEELRGGWRIRSGVEEAVALAVIAGHHWATTSAAVPSSPGAPVVTVEAVERPGAHHAVVTLLVAAPSAGARDIHRIAVPVLLGAEAPVLAGEPWVLPAPTMRTSPLDGTAIGDTELIAAARRALESIGVAGERLVALEVTEGWPFIARLDDDAAGHPWLRWHVDRFVVAGLPLDAAGG